MLAQISGALELNFASTHWFLGRILTLVFDQLRAISGFAFGRIFGHFVAGLRAISGFALGRIFGHFVAVKRLIFGLALGVYSDIL